MQLSIRGPQDVVTSEFGQWLCLILKARLEKHLNSPKLQKWDQYLTSTSVVKRLYTRPYTVSEVVSFAAKHLSCVVVTGLLIIRFDSTKFVPGFDRLPLTTAIKLLSHGNRDIEGCPIFRDAFESVKNQIVDLARLYYGI